MPFLSVVTRCYKRPNMLHRNVQSLKEQIDQDYEQIFIEDKFGRGVGWANRALSTAKPDGDYVMVLDDDDMLVNRWAITILKGAVHNKPDLVMFKADHNGLGILPDDLVWKRKPLRGHIGSIDFITRRDVWERYIHRFGVDECGDYAFLHAIWFDQPQVEWCDELLASVQRISRGAPE